MVATEDSVWCELTGPAEGEEILERQRQKQRTKAEAERERRNARAVMSSAALRGPGQSQALLLPCKRLARSVISAAGDTRNPEVSHRSHVLLRGMIPDPREIEALQQEKKSSTVSRISRTEQNRTEDFAHPPQPVSDQIVLPLRLAATLSWQPQSAAPPHFTATVAGNLRPPLCHFPSL